MMDETDNPYSPPERSSRSNERPRAAFRFGLLPLSDLQAALLALAVVAVAAGLLAVGHGFYVRFFLGD